jgi:hypothetical protein
MGYPVPLAQQRRSNFPHTRKLAEALLLKGNRITQPLESAARLAII